MKVLLYLCLLLPVLYSGAFAEAGDFTDGFVLSHLKDGWMQSSYGDSQAAYDLTGDSLMMAALKGEHAFDLKVNFGALKILRECPAEFIAETKIKAQTVAAVQGAGLLYFMDERNYIKLYRVMKEGSKQTVMLEGYIDGVAIAPQWLDFGDVNFILRMSCVGGKVSGWCSIDGAEWLKAGELDAGFGEGVKIGLFLENQWQDNPFSAEFYYFKLYKK